MIVHYTDIHERCGIEPELVRLWVRKGYIPGDDNGVELNDLETFLSDIGPYAMGWMSTGRTLSVGYRCFMGLWAQVVGTEMADCLKRFDRGDSLQTLAAEQGVSVSSLQYRIRKATRLLKDYFVDIPALNRRTKPATPETVGEATAVASDSAEEELLGRWRAPLTVWGLSAKCVHAAERAGISSLGDMLLVNQACGRAGMLRQIAHFGKGAYDEVQRLLLKEGLIRGVEGDYWQVSRPEWIDRHATLYLRYKSEKSERIDIEEHNWVKQSLIVRSKLGR